MKTNFLLALLVLNGLIFGAKSAAAFTDSSQNSQQIADLSQSISKSIDLNEDARNLLESAIHRALLAKQERSNQPQVEPEVAGGIKSQGANPPIINGKVAQPRPQPSGKPIINGMMLPQPPQTERPQIRPIPSDRR